MRDYTFTFETSRQHTRKLMRYLSKAEGYGEDSDTVYACDDLRDTMRQKISDLAPEEPTEIGSIVLAPLHRDDEGLVEWVCSGDGNWHHNRISRFWYDLDVYEVKRVGADTSDQQKLRRRINGLVGVILEAHDRARPGHGRSEETIEALKSNYMLQVQFMEEMLLEIDPDYKVRGTRTRGNLKTPIELGGDGASE